MELFPFDINTLPIEVVQNIVRQSPFAWSRCSHAFRKLASPSLFGAVRINTVSMKKLDQLHAILSRKSHPALAKLPDPFAYLKMIILSGNLDAAEAVIMAENLSDIDFSDEVWTHALEMAKSVGSSETCPPFVKQAIDAYLKKNPNTPDAEIVSKVQSTFTKSMETMSGTAEYTDEDRDPLFDLVVAAEALMQILMAEFATQCGELDELLMYGCMDPQITIRSAIKHCKKFKNLALLNCTMKRSCLDVRQLAQLSQFQISLPKDIPGDDLEEDEMGEDGGVGSIVCCLLAHVLVPSLSIEISQPVHLSLALPKQLDLSNVKVFRFHVDLEIADIALHPNLQQPVNIIASQSLAAVTAPLSMLESLARYLKQLQHVQIPDHPTVQEIVPILRKCTSLKSLAIHPAMPADSVSVNLALLAEILPPTLCRLALPYPRDHMRQPHVWKVGQDHSWAINCNLPNLQELDLSSLYAKAHAFISLTLPMEQLETTNSDMLDGLLAEAMQLKGLFPRLRFFNKFFEIEQIDGRLLLERSSILHVLTNHVHTVFDLERLMKRYS